MKGTTTITIRTRTRTSSTTSSTSITSQNTRFTVDLQSQGEGGDVVVGNETERQYGVRHVAPPRPVPTASQDTFFIVLAALILQPQPTLPTRVHSTLARPVSADLPFPSVQATVSMDPQPPSPVFPGKPPSPFPMHIHNRSTPFRSDRRIEFALMRLYLLYSHCAHSRPCPSALPPSPHFDRNCTPRMPHPMVPPSRTFLPLLSIGVCLCCV
jgi:hypothetical protein